MGRVPTPPSPPAPPLAAARSLADDVRARTDEQLRRAPAAASRPRPSRPRRPHVTGGPGQHPGQRPAGARLPRPRPPAGARGSHACRRAPSTRTCSASTSARVPTSRRSCTACGRPRCCGAAATGLHVTRMAAEALGPHVAGLGPPRRRHPRNDPGRPGRPGDGRRPARHCARAGPRHPRPPRLGAAAGRAARAGHPGRVAEGARWLLTERPRAVGLGRPGRACPARSACALRGGRLHRELAAAAARPDRSQHARRRRSTRPPASRSATCWRWSTSSPPSGGLRPPRVLRAGGLAVRDLRRLRLGARPARARGQPSSPSSRLTAGLVARRRLARARRGRPPRPTTSGSSSPGASGGRCSPRPGCSPPAPRTSSAPLPPGPPAPSTRSAPTSHWPPARGPARGRPRPSWPLAPGTARPAAAQRRAPLRLAPPATAAGEPRHRGGRRARARRSGSGVTGRGALSRRRAGAARRRGPTPRSPRRCTRTCQSPSSTSCCRPTSPPSRPDRSRAARRSFMRLVADVESRGGATVYRFTPDSVRRCLDAGWSVDQVLGGAHRRQPHAGPPAAGVPHPRRRPSPRPDAGRRRRRLHPLRRRGHPRRDGRRPRAVAAPAAAASPRPSSSRPWRRDGARLPARERLRARRGDPRRRPRRPASRAPPHPAAATAQPASRPTPSTTSWCTHDGRRAARGRGGRGIPARAAGEPARTAACPSTDPDHDARRAARRGGRPAGGLDRLLRRGRAGPAAPVLPRPGRGRPRARHRRRGRAHPVDPPRDRRVQG